MSSFQADINTAIILAVNKYLKLLGAKPTLSSMFSQLEENERLRRWVAMSVALGMVSREDLSMAVSNALSTYGHTMYRLVDGKNGTPPDHVPSPEALAYALGQLPLCQLAPTVRFNHGETLEHFLARADRLVERVVEELLAPDPAPPSTV